MTISCDDSAFLEARIAAGEAFIVAAEEAIFALTVTGVQSYTLDTGQTRQVVTKANITELRKAISAAINQRSVLRASLGCGGSYHVTSPT